MNISIKLKTKASKVRHSIDNPRSCRMWMYTTRITHLRGNLIAFLI